MYLIYDMAGYRYVIDMTFGGVFVGFRVGNAKAMLYDSNEHPNDRDKVLINLR